MEPEKFRGNWKKFESFHWYNDEIEDKDNWGQYSLETRDSGILERSNSACIQKVMREADPEGQDYTIEQHGHWACGYVTVLCVRVYKPEVALQEAAEKMGMRLVPEIEEPTTKAFRAFSELADSLESYPSLDDSGFSDMEYKAQEESIASNRNLAIDDVPEGWEGKVFDWLWDNYQIAVESGNEGYVNEEGVKKALVALSWYDWSNDKDGQCECGKDVKQTSVLVEGEVVKAVLVCTECGQEYDIEV